MPQFQPQGLQYIGQPPGQQQGPLDTLQKLMAMKMQYDQEEKQMQQQLKDRLKEIKMQHDMAKDLFTWEADEKARQKKAEMEEQINRATGAAQGLRSAYTDKEFVGPSLPGQEPLTGIGKDIAPLADYYAQFGEKLPISAPTQSMRGEVQPINIYQGELQKDIAEKKGKTAEDIARMREESRMAGLKLSLAAKKEMVAARGAIAIEIAKMKQGISPDRKADIEAAKMVEYVARNIAGKGEEVTEENRIEAITYLTNLYPETFGEYATSIEEQEPGWLNKLTLGLFGGPTKTIKRKEQTITPLENYNWK